jgi:hypothetical protein
MKLSFCLESTYSGFSSFTSLCYLRIYAKADIVDDWHQIAMHNEEMINIG